MTHYPIVLVNLENAIIVGGGSVATRKVQGLLDASVKSVTVIAPQFTSQLETWVTHNRVTPIRRPYQQGDLANTQLVIAATDDESVNQAVWDEAHKHGILINAVDDPPHCTFHVPAVVRRGNLAIAISTGGASPALAKHMRRELERVIGLEYEKVATLMAELRPRINCQIPFEKREALWEAIIETTLPLLHAERDDQAQQAIEEIILRATVDQDG